jgi:hypothetical protein
VLKMCSHIWRQLLLALAVFIAVAAFIPEIAHLQAASDNHAELPTDHYHPDTDAQEGPCHTGATCTGAIDIRSYAAQINIGLLVEQHHVVFAINHTSHVSVNDPPVPIRSVS